ncbi:TetR/AcrR family transcriptional regulator [Microbacterium sp. RG1]|uniref:TetR/AcrR family transcriptional regulator n=1 Tax=Microbacterium sp. RG1 TaxID=2489212 RepID=UPI0010CA57DA|nr:TetR family transcriptional regulator [Microbacterium sp. RG1]QCQ17439.1 TetR family transcriptional regulator [Microbacterium sp. RG1]
MPTAVSSRPDALRNRAALVEAATSLIARDPHASIASIAEAAGVSRRAVYGHFPDRGALVAELVRSGAERFNVLAAETITDEPAPLALARLTARLWDEAAQVQVAASLALDDAHIEQTAYILAPVRRRLMAIVREGQDAETLRTDLTAATLARLIEEAARMVITRIDAASSHARGLAARTVLSIAGLSWRETDALLETHPELAEED